MPPFEDYDVRAPIITRSYDVKDGCTVEDIHNVSVELITDILSEVVKHQEGEVVDGDRLEDLVVDEEEEDPDYVQDSDVTEDSLEFKSETGLEIGADLVNGEAEIDDLDYSLESDVTEDSLEFKSLIDFEEEVGYLNYFISQNDFASLVTKSCSDLIDKENVGWTYVNRVQEYLASFGATQLGIRLVDTGLSVVEAPISLFSSCLSGSVKSSRRHLRAVRRAGTKLNGSSCKTSSFLVHVADVFKVNTLLGGILGIKLADRVNKRQYLEDFESDPEYVASSDESEDSLEYRSDVEFAFKEDLTEVESEGESETDDEL